MEQTTKDILKNIFRSKSNARDRQIAVINNPELTDTDKMKGIINAETDDIKSEIFLVILETYKYFQNVSRAGLRYHYDRTREAKLMHTMMTDIREYYKRLNYYTDYDKSIRDDVLRWMYIKVHNKFIEKMHGLRPPTQTGPLQGHFPIQ